jgi:hypothetical protein
MTCPSFAIWGHLQILRGVDPIASFRHRKPMWRAKSVR